MNADDQDRFVEAWGSMGSLWGINRSVARVHALLMASDLPLNQDDIAERLGMSKGNASMSLRELRTFGVIRQASRPGDRREHYVTEPDVWTMFFRILAERKRRELDPAVTAVRAAVAGSASDGPVKQRLDQLADLLGQIDGVARRLLDHPAAGRAALTLLSSFPGGSAPGS